MPPAGEPHFRREGGAIVLRGCARGAWQDRSSQWMAISSRLIVARLWIARVDGESTWLPVIVYYVPTFHAPWMVKDKCFTDVQEALRSVLSSERFVVLGDFNARVASRSGPDDEWGTVRGPHGIGDIILLARNYYLSST